VKCADIPDDQFLDAVAAVIRKRGMWANRWDVAAVLDGHPEWIGERAATDGESVRMPEKLVLAKARKLIRRGLLSGCFCGCRSDFELTVASAAQRGVPAASW
jgi:hypothetical protein